MTKAAIQANLNKATDVGLDVPAQVAFHAYFLGRYDGADFIDLGFGQVFHARRRVDLRF